MGEVYFASARVKEFRKWWVPEASMIAKLEHLFFAASLDKVIEKGDEVGLKMHMGEPGNVHYLRPVYTSKIIEIIKKLGGKPKVVETTGLGWIPGRTSASKYLEAARRNGFCEETLGAPIIIADGEDGLLGVKIKDVFVAKGIVELDSMIVLSHFTGHIQAGFGGAIKNIGLGCVAKAGKFRVHHSGTPKIDKSLCNACRKCLEACPAEAISDEIEITEKCMLCNTCIDICGEGAIKVKINSPEEISKRTAENAAAVVAAFKNGKIGYINLLMDIIPHCDCHPHSDIPIVPDIGALASFDPVAIDRASIDMVNSSPGIPKSAAEDAKALDSGKEKFKLLNPRTNWKVLIDTAEKLGLGEQRYIMK